MEKKAALAAVCAGCTYFDAFYSPPKTGGGRII